MRIRLGSDLQWRQLNQIRATTNLVLVEYVGYIYCCRCTLRIEGEVCMASCQCMIPAMDDNRRLSVRCCHQGVRVARDDEGARHN